MNKTWVFGDYAQAEPRIVAWAGPVPQLKAWFKEGKDVHTEVLRQISRVVQTGNIVLPNRLFARKPWQDYGKEDTERNLAKNTVNGNNYGLGKRKFGLITGLPERYAEILQRIYFRLFPEVRTGYQAWIKSQLPIITMPQGWPIQFYGRPDEEMERKAFSLYAQSTVGLLITKTLCDVCEHHPDAKGIWTPQRIAAGGYPVQLQIHDAIGVPVADDPLAIREAVETISHYASQELIIKGEALVLPMDFRVGHSWGDLKPYVG